MVNQENYVNVKDLHKEGWTSSGSLRRPAGIAARSASN